MLAMWTGVREREDGEGGTACLTVLANIACSRTGGAAAVVEEAHEPFTRRLESRCYPILHDRY